MSIRIEYGLDGTMQVRAFISPREQREMTSRQIADWMDAVALLFASQMPDDRFDTDGAAADTRERIDLVKLDEEFRALLNRRPPEGGGRA